MQVKVAPVSSTNLNGPRPLILTGTMIAASFGGAISKGTSPGVIEAGVPKSLEAGSVQPDQISNESAQIKLGRKRMIVTSLNNDLLKGVLRARAHVRWRVPAWRVSVLSNLLVSVVSLIPWPEFITNTRKSTDEKLLLNLHFALAEPVAILRACFLSLSEINEHSRR